MSIDSTALGDRMKKYEKEFSTIFSGERPVVCRVDGRHFHSFTRGLKRPFDEKIAKCMIKTAVKLAEATGASLTYVQSDEITLAWETLKENSQLWFGGKSQKMISQTSALATLFFYQEVQKHLSEYATKEPSFDSRVWEVPKEELYNVFLWRIRDAKRNAIQGAGQFFVGKSKILGIKTDELYNMLMRNYSAELSMLPEYYWKGVFIERRSFDFLNDEGERYVRSRYIVSDKSLKDFFIK